MHIVNNNKKYIHVKQTNLFVKVLIILRKRKKEVPGILICFIYKVYYYGSCKSIYCIVHLMIETQILVNTIIV